MEPVVEPRDRYNLRKSLTRLERDITALEEAGTLTLDEDILKQYRVKALPLSLDGTESLAPKFFSAFVPKDIPEPTQEFVGREYNTSRITLTSEYGRLIGIYLQSYIRKLMLDFPEIRQIWSSRQIGDYDFGNLYRMFEPEFGTLLILHVAKASKPHIKCIMHNDIRVDDSHLLCGELLTVVRIMLGQLKQKGFVNDMLAPVLLLSLNQHHPRAIEAYFDGQQLTVRRTDAYDFRSLNTAGFKTFARWFLGSPVGDTSNRAVHT
ncbi:hypothetical protein BDV25DRAFT_146637 [Aspergillus avenaceus]|uniref:Kinetochore complex Sim4 subunit Fta1-domain-containing protein n=1 Tax=Aspergillus avenaceus TaxID=36643 RepID=A0A5N6U977_ASPAV|nr:hypothetical protein BDV25DRAFT_146637 [Aspergillus avenaceus]